LTKINNKLKTIPVRITAKESVGLRLSYPWVTSADVIRYLTGNRIEKTERTIIIKIKINLLFSVLAMF
jgi:hypothetical protein